MSLPVLMIAARQLGNSTFESYITLFLIGKQFLTMIKSLTVDSLTMVLFTVDFLTVFTRYLLVIDFSKRSNKS